MVAAALLESERERFLDERLLLALSFGRDADAEDCVGLEEVGEGLRVGVEAEGRREAVCVGVEDDDEGGPPTEEHEEEVEAAEETQEEEGAVAPEGAQASGALDGAERKVTRGLAAATSRCFESRGATAEGGCKRLRFNLV